MPKLVRVSRSQRMEIMLEKDATVFGREATCDAVFENDPQISREHCGFRRYKDGVITVTDYGSSNGTFVNKERIFEEIPLHDGDKIKLGNRTEFVLEAPELAPKKVIDEAKAQKTTDAKPTEPKAKAKVSKKPRIEPPKSKEEKVAAELAAELEEKSYASVMQELVGKTKQGKRKSPRQDGTAENTPNQYW